MRLILGSHPPIMEPDDETVEGVIRALNLQGTATSFVRGFFNFLRRRKDESFAILIESDETNNFIQTESTFLVEYRDSVMERHYKMEGVPIETVVVLFQSYCRGEISWRNDFPWKDITTEFTWHRRDSIESDVGSSENLVPNVSLGAVYLLKAGPYYKIGKSINSEQRFDQIRLQLPYPVEMIHQITTDDVSGIEYYWHKRFADKRANGEWFLLTDEEVVIFKSRTRM